jgi:hypothetical protein
LFSAPVPKPVLVAPLHVTVLPDWTHAASAGPAGTMAAVTVDKTNGAARVSHRPTLTFAVNSSDSTVLVRAAPSIIFIIQSQLSRPKQPPPAN